MAQRPNAVAAVGVALCVIVSGCSNDLKRAEELLELGSYDEAITLAQKVASDSPRKAQAHLIIGMARASRGFHGGKDGDLDTGLRELETAANLDPETGRIPFFIGMVQLRRSDQHYTYAALRESFERAAKAKQPFAASTLYLPDLMEGAPLPATLPALASEAERLPTDLRWRFVTVSSDIGTFFLVDNQEAVSDDRHAPKLAVEKLTPQLFIRATEARLYFAHSTYVQRRGAIEWTAGMVPSAADLERSLIFPGMNWLGPQGQPVDASRVQPGSRRFLAQTQLGAAEIQYQWRASSYLYSLDRAGAVIASGDLDRDRARLALIGAHPQWPAELRERLVHMGLAVGMPWPMVLASVGPLTLKDVQVDERGFRERWEGTIVVLTVLNGTVVAIESQPGKEPSLTDTYQQAPPSRPATMAGATSGESADAGRVSTASSNQR